MQVRRPELIRIERNRILTVIQYYLDLDVVKTRLVHFEGTVWAAAISYPKNVNISAHKALLTASTVIRFPMLN